MKKKEGESRLEQRWLKKKGAYPSDGLRFLMCSNEKQTEQADSKEGALGEGGAATRKRREIANWRKLR